MNSSASADLQSSVSSSSEQSYSSDLSSLFQSLPPTLRRNLCLTVFSYFDGSSLFHKVSLLNHSYRNNITSSGLLDQPKEICVSNKGELDTKNCQYGFNLATSINFNIGYSSPNQSNFDILKALNLRNSLN
jgi:hypothetical protein